MNKKIINKIVFYALSFTWGIVMSLIGGITALVLLILKYKPEKFGYCIYFKVGKNWGGVNLGPVIITDTGSAVSTKSHEHGHAIQNCVFGPFMIIVSVMSAARYWYREFKYYRKGKAPTTAYDSVWFEGSATKLGTAFIEALNK